MDDAPRSVPPSPRAEAAPRLLFLDDDPRRAAAFAADHPQMVWVQTARECLDLLDRAWDEVHLDHDLGGETLVDAGRDDCGMEVVRWLSAEPRPHLKDTAFVVHSHNINAACMMALHLESMGYRVRTRPFGSGRRRSGLWHWIRSALSGLVVSGTGRD